MDTPTKEGLEAVNTRIGREHYEVYEVIKKLEARVATLEAAAEKKYGKGS